MKIDIKALAEQLELAAGDLRSLDAITAENRIHGVLVMLSGHEWLMGPKFTPPVEQWYTVYADEDAYRCRQWVSYARSEAEAIQNIRNSTSAEEDENLTDWRAIPRIMPGD